MDEIWYKWKFGAMPIDSQNFRTVCGCFLPTFLSFMCRRAREAKLRRVRVLKCRTVTLNVLCFFLTFVIAAVMQQAGDVETNPGPNGEGNDENGTTLGKLCDMVSSLTAAITRVEQSQSQLATGQSNLSTQFAERLSQLETKFEASVQRLSDENETGGLSHELKVP